MRTHGLLAMARKTGLGQKPLDERRMKAPRRQDDPATQQPLNAVLKSLQEAGHNGTVQSTHLAGRPHNQRVTIMLPTSLIDRLRNAVYWTGDRTLAQLITGAVGDVVSDLEHANGGAFPARLSPLKRGRPARKPASPRASRSARAASEQSPSRVNRRRGLPGPSGG